jgi:hypothetical protein
MKIIIPFTCLLLGLVIGAKFFSTTETTQEVAVISDSNSQKKFTSFKSAAQNISNTDLLEYTKLKTMKEKYEKADEILGKIMLLFLANIHLEMNKEVKDYFSSNKRPILKDHLPKVISFGEKKKTKVIISPYERLEKVQAIAIEDEKFSMINKKTAMFNLKSPYKTFKNAKPATRLEEIFAVYGKYAGELYITKGKNKGKIDTVTLDIKFEQIGNKINGTYFSELKRDGVAYSTKRGRGDNNQIRLVKSPKEHLLIQMSPNSFIQVSPLSDSDVLIGRFYDDDEFRGLVKLDRL